MKIDSNQLEPMILRGARIAYEVNHQGPWECKFEQWLGFAQEVSQKTGRAHTAEQLAEWARRACDGETDTHYADLPLEDQKALIVARRALAAVSALDEMAAVTKS